jgi:hypothetical protein
MSSTYRDPGDTIAPLTRSQKNSEKKLDRANSWARAICLFRLFAVEHPRKVEILGNEWSGCDRYPKEMSLILQALPCPALDAMTVEEQ